MNDEGAWVWVLGFLFALVQSINPALDMIKINVGIFDFSDRKNNLTEIIRDPLYSVGIGNPNNGASTDMYR
jgi:hypothetical protein